MKGFNPCFNGSCIRIFVVSHKTEECKSVSILVLMDLAFEWTLQNTPINNTEGFNPCFNGSCIRITQETPIQYRNIRFNPCFNGSCIRIRIL